MKLLRLRTEFGLVVLLSLSSPIGLAIASAADGGGDHASAWDGRLTRHRARANDRDGRSTQTADAADGAIVRAEPRPDPLRWKPSTGQDARNYPTDPQVDFQHMSLAIDIPDMNTPAFTASETLSFQTYGRELSTLRLDANRLIIKRVVLASTGKPVDWSDDGKSLQIKFDPPLAADSSHSLLIDYTLKDPIEGLYWSPARAAAPGRPARAAQLYSQGEADMNRNWFVCHDFPNDKLTTELIVTVPEGFLVSSNGELVLEQTKGARTTFHWKQDKPHSSYLVTLVVGKFDVVDVGDDQLSMPVYVPPGQGKLVKQSYGHVIDMIHTFEDRLDEPYPWARYAEILVWNFGYGGMENTSATTLYGAAVLDAKALQDADLDGLTSHELGHQWFGDLLTCNSWEHIWLNEGFATYMEALWFEARDGFDDGYLLDMYRNVRGIAARDQIQPDDDHGWRRPAVVSKLFAGPDDVFRRRSNPYPKGASVLHMLRMKLGDNVFFKGLQTYVNRFKFKTVETSDFRRTMEDVSGLSLEQFFDQWLSRPGTPEVSVASDWDYDNGALHLVVEQTQRIDAMTPAYVFDLPILIESESGEQTWVEVHMTGRRHERTVHLGGPPTMVVVDPYLHVLMTPTVHQPTGQIIAQLRDGPTVAARLGAAKFLEDESGSDVTTALAESLTDSGENHAVRSASARTLGELNAADALADAFNAPVADARVRLAIIRAMDKIDGDDFTATFADRAADLNESYAVRAAALLALGKHGDRAYLKILLAALEDDSQNDQVRRGALRGLAKLGEPEGLDQAIRFSQIGWMSRTRPVAIRAIADLADDDPDKAIDALIPLLRDPESRSRRAAGAALARVGDERALDEMRRIAKTDPHPDFRDRLANWADELAAKLHKEDSSQDVRRRLEKLERKVENLSTDKDGGD